MPFDGPGVGAGDDDEVGVAAGVAGRPCSFSTISSAGMTCLPSKWPQRLGVTWSSSRMPAAPARSNSRTVRTTLCRSPWPVSPSATTGMRHALGHAADGVGHLGQRDEADVGQAEQAGRGAEAAEEDGLQPGRLDEPGGEDVVRPEAADDAGPGQQVTQAAGGRHGCFSGPNNPGGPNGGDRTLPDECTAAPRSRAEENVSLVQANAGRGCGRREASGSCRVRGTWLELPAGFLQTRFPARLTGYASSGTARR